LAAIGAILVLKQIPHLLGHDSDPEGEMSFDQPDHENTFTELWSLLSDVHPGAVVIGLTSIAVLVCWERSRTLKRTGVPSQLIVVLWGISLSMLFRAIGGPWLIEARNLVQVPVADGLTGLLGLLEWPDFSHWKNPAVYSAGLTIAAVASLETLLNLEAADKIDPRQRHSSPSRELIAQGVGNVTAGLLGGIPITSAIVRSSVNITAGAQSKASAITHGVLLLFSVLLFPAALNTIPLSCLAAILLVTGVRLISWTLMRRMWLQGRYQFIPFAATLVAIVLTDLLVGVLIGMAISIGFILNSNLRRPMRRFVEKQLGGDVLHLELANQVGFLNRAALTKALADVPRGGHVLLDARNTDYIDPDVLDLIRDYQEKTGPARQIKVSLLGFRRKYQLADRIQYVDYSTRELQSSLTPERVLQILKDGHARFRSGRRLTRDLGRQVHATAQSQHPLAVVLGCIDSRGPAELIFDLGLGDVFSVRVAGNVPGRKVLGSIEYGCAVAGAKLILVLGHTRCGAVTAALQQLAGGAKAADDSTGCQHIAPILHDIQRSIDPATVREFAQRSEADQTKIVDRVARANVLRTMAQILEQSETLAELVETGAIAIAGAMYDVTSGELTFLAVEDHTADAKELTV
jgi:carbonic anhydrase/SulP family sulfate permease